MRELVNIVGLERVVSDIGQEIESDYARWDEFDKSSRHAVHVRNGVIELMPTSDGKRYAFKYVTGHPNNTHKGLLTVVAFGVLADVDTGYPHLVAEMTFATALRTAAMSAIAARWLARTDSRTMAVIGAGAQSEFQVLAFHTMRGIKNFRLFDTDGAAARKLVHNIQALPQHDICLTPCKSIEMTVDGADVITTVTADKRKATVLMPKHVHPGVHINAVGGDCPGKTELHVDILLRPDAKIFVEYEPQTRLEGEIQQLDASSAVREFGDVVRGRVAGRESDLDVTIFDSVGFALEDFSTLRYLSRINQERGGQREYIDLIPELDDPKDLFGSLMGSRRGSRLSAVR
jgi:ornithine cyclodeaminase